MNDFNWSDKKITHLHIELTNYCNAKCPFCPRFISGTPIVRPDLKLSNISLKQFKKWFPPEIIYEIQRILFCGTHGEPTMAKDFLEILKYIKLNNPKCNIIIHTNGATHNLTYWKILGEILFNKNTYKDHVIFSIDGLEDTNHLYRKNVKWSKLMVNVKSYLSTGAIAEWDFLTFKHNEHQIEEARQLSKDMGFGNFYTKRALGFEEIGGKESPVKGVYDKDGNLEYILQAPNQKNLINTNNKDENHEPKQVLKKINFERYKNYKDGYNPDVEKRIQKFDYSNIQSFNNYIFKYDGYDIKCKSYTDSKNAEIYINSNGIVYPCCWVGTRVDSEVDYFEDTQLRYEMRKVGMDKFDLENNSLDEIKKILDLVFQKSWDIENIVDGKMLMCAMVCGKNSSIDRVYIEREY